MKYLLFAVAALGVPPLAWILSMNRRWLRWAFAAVVAALCLYNQTSINFFSYEEYRGSSRGMEVSLAHLMAAAFLFVAAFKRKFPKPVPSAGAALFLVYFCLCLPSLGAAENALFSWMELWKMILLYLTYLSVRAYLAVTDDVKSFVGFMAAFTIWNFLLVVKAHFSGVYQPHGVFPHQNGLAMAMHLFANLFFAVYLVEGGRRAKLSAFAFVAAAACLVRTYSRGALAMVPLAFSVTFALTAFVTRAVRPGRLFSRALPVVLAGAVGLAAMLPRIVERFETAPEASANTRVELARCAVEMIKDEPWRGVGINNWGIKINPPYDYADRAGRNTNRDDDFKDGIVETVYLLVGAECGVPALLAMMAWFGSYLLLGVRLCRKLRGTPWAAIPAGLSGGFVALYVQSCLEWTLRIQQNLLLLVFFFALLDHLNANARRIRAEAAARPERSLHATA